MMTQSTTISRRGAFQAAFAMLGGLAGLTGLRAASGGGGAGQCDEKARNRATYREFDKFGRVVLEIGPRTSRWEQFVYV